MTTTTATTTTTTKTTTTTTTTPARTSCALATRCSTRFGGLYSDPKLTYDLDLFYANRQDLVAGHVFRQRQGGALSYRHHQERIRPHQPRRLDHTESPVSSHSHMQ